MISKNKRLRLLVIPPKLISVTVTSRSLISLSLLLSLLGEDLIWGQYMEACKDEDIGMNIYTRALPATGGKGEDLIWGRIHIYFSKNT